MVHINKLIEEVCKEYLNSRDPFNTHAEEAYEHWSNLVSIVFDADIEQVQSAIANAALNLEEGKRSNAVIEELTDSK